MRQNDCLWEELYNLLKVAGLLPVLPEAMTPAEIAAHVRTVSGDDRAEQFIRDYHYPNRYGGETGAMTHEAALLLLASFKTHEIRETTASDVSPASPCLLCIRRNAREIT